MPKRKLFVEEEQDRRQKRNKKRSLPLKTTTRLLLCSIQQFPSCQPTDNHDTSKIVGSGLAELFPENDQLPEMLEEIFMGGVLDDDINELPAAFEREDVRNFDKLFEDAQRKVFPGSNSTILSFIVKILHTKVHGKLSNHAFDMMMQVIKSLLPVYDEFIPWNIREAKKLLRDLGLGYVRIDVCRYDCILFWKENANLENCPRCKESRYKVNDGKSKKIPHKEKRVDDGVLRHPADGEEWKNFDVRYPTFAADPRNVRLGLATDGFNPFRNMSTSYSVWPIIVMPYNLPPWKCMKEPFCMMSLLIPGRHAPGRDIDVYLRPLIDELKELWEDGVQTYDASNGEFFRMHAAVMWTINDFPAYGNMSGWTTKGYLACPICNEDASSQSLRSKIGYMGARRFLPKNHRWRKSKLFNGEVESRSRPLDLTGEEILRQIELGAYKLPGKHPNNRKRHRGENPILNWTKRSILFELPYWKTLKLRHCLDVMHIEKNIFDNLIETLLGVDGKSKDTEKARRDLEDMRIRKELHLKKRADGSFEKPPALYTLSPIEKLCFLEFLKSTKCPDGYAANISTCISTQGSKLTDLKTHDCHILLQRLLPIGMRGFLNEEISTALFELGNFFQQLCSKTLKVEDLDKLEDHIILVLCKLEKIFPPAFFDVMVHLAMHLPREGKLGGPVHYRLLGVLKHFVGNKARPEGSIAEAYVSKECTTFCSMYLDGIETVFNREERNNDGGERGPELEVFTQSVRPFGLIPRAPDVPINQREMAHWFVLFNSSEVEPYLEEHKTLLASGSADDIPKRQRKEFLKWFKERVNNKRGGISSPCTPPPPPIWKPPDGAFIKFNADGGLNVTNEVGGLDLVARDSSGMLLGARMESMKDEGLRLQLSKLLLNTSEESDQESSEEINELDYSTSSESEYPPPKDCTGKCCTSYQDPLKVFANLNGLSLNVLTKSQQDILDLVDKVQDPEIRRKIIELSLNSTISEAEPSEKPPDTTRAAVQKTSEHSLVLKSHKSTFCDSGDATAQLRRCSNNLSSKGGGSRGGGGEGYGSAGGGGFGGSGVVSPVKQAGHSCEG
ncbi:hypothetical protein Vadar_012013 [Vaccinium darrowii]|uniref:Uncharacterized protein n=1 Tax=Vaccinium darrowii TaxID=229202 RepID=A0ACB7XQ15_9ERIC|nr:hypothetical protein Vadar_012013 [Vaccinium darrowii]